MITFRKFGRHGRLGNQLFQLAGMIGLSKKYNQDLTMPQWKYQGYFANIPYISNSRPAAVQFNQLQESTFHYTESNWTQLSTGNHNITAWLQTEKFWEHCIDDIRKVFAWDTQFQKHIIKTTKLSNLQNAIAISVRRGDYVGNPNYDLLPVSYYMQALRQYFPDYLDRQILIFSDDIPYCKIHFEGLPNVWFAEGLNDICQLCLMSNCGGFIISNSTFAWWGAYLAELRDPSVKIIRPRYLFAGDLLKSSDSKDHWPWRWLSYDHKEADGTYKKYDLKDVTFTIPVAYDHNDRKENLELGVCMLQRTYHTNIYVGEGITRQFEYMSQWCKYRHFEMDRFHRTKILNQLAWESPTSIIANWDCDVFVPEVQVMVSVDMIRADKLEGAYPYDGRFARVPRSQWFKPLEQSFDVGIFKDQRFRGTSLQKERSSVGGAVFWNRIKFFEGGGENEQFISHAPEDAERWDRFHLLGYRIARIGGQLFHMDHWVGPNSSNRHGFREHNSNIWAKHRSITTAEQMWEYVKSWEWYRIPGTDHIDTMLRQQPHHGPGYREFIKDGRVPEDHPVMGLLSLYNETLKAIATSIEPMAKQWVHLQSVDYGDLNAQAEAQLIEAFCAGYIKRYYEDFQREL